MAEIRKAFKLAVLLAPPADFEDAEEERWSTLAAYYGSRDLTNSLCIASLLRHLPEDQVKRLPKILDLVGHLDPDEVTKSNERFAKIAKDKGADFELEWLQETKDGLKHNHLRCVMHSASNSSRSRLTAHLSRWALARARSGRRSWSSFCTDPERDCRLHRCRHASSGRKDFVVALRCIARPARTLAPCYFALCPSPTGSPRNCCAHSLSIKLALARLAMISLALLSSVLALALPASSEAHSLPRPDLTPRAMQPRFESMIVWGASYCDTGAIAPDSAVGAWSYERRWTNGPVFVEHLQKLVGPRDGVNSTLSNYSRAGARIRALTGEPATSTKAKVPGYVDEHLRRVVEHNGDHWDAERLFKSTQLYIIWIGLNSLQAWMDDFNQADQRLAQAVEWAGKIAEAIKPVIEQKKAARSGDYRIIVMTLPELEITPKYRGDANIADLAALAKAYNVELSRAVVTLNTASSAAGAGNVALLYNAAAHFRRYVTKPSDYGLTNTDSYLTRTSHLDPSMTPATQRAYLWWDQLHPTARIHEDLAADLKTFLDANMG